MFRLASDLRHLWRRVLPCVYSVDVSSLYHEVL
nr:MAG TPA: hypothetical protein [Caudoviricetes sp.]